MISTLPPESFAAFAANLPGSRNANRQETGFKTPPSGKRERGGRKDRPLRVMGSCIPPTSTTPSFASTATLRPSPVRSSQ